MASGKERGITSHQGMGKGKKILLVQDSTPSLDPTDGNNSL